MTDGPGIGNAFASQPPQRVLRSVWSLTVWGAPRTKKTSNVAYTVPVRGKGGAVVLDRDGHPRRRPVIQPSEAWRRWVKEAAIERPAGFATIIEPVNCAAAFYRDKNIGDAVGFYQGLADLLQERGIVSNDRLIVSWDGSRLLKDAEHPRVELVLAAAPFELAP